LADKVLMVINVRKLKRFLPKIIFLYKRKLPIDFWVSPINPKIFLFSLTSRQ